MQALRLLPRVLWPYLGIIIYEKAPKLYHLSLAIIFPEVTLIYKNIFFFFFVRIALFLLRVNVILLTNSSGWKHLTTTLLANIYTKVFDFCFFWICTTDEMVVLKIFRFSFLFFCLLLGEAKDIQRVINLSRYCMLLLQSSFFMVLFLNEFVFIKITKERKTFCMHDFYILHLLTPFLLKSKRKKKKKNLT